MEQTRALNALAPFVALAKSANSPRAAADLITQATSVQNTYVFAELLQQPNIQALAANEQFGAHYKLLEIFAWGTWEAYQATTGLPALSDAQAVKLRLLSLLTIASQKSASSPSETNLSYASLCTQLSLTRPVELEQLVTMAIYNDLITAALNPHQQTVIIGSVAPLRDLAPGSVTAMISELEAWSGRCDDVLASLEHEIAAVKARAAARHKREQVVEKQVKAVTDAAEKGSGGALGQSRTGHNTRGTNKRDGNEDDDYGDSMEIDSGNTGKKRSGGGGGGGLLGRLRGSR